MYLERGSPSGCSWLGIPEVSLVETGHERPTMKLVELSISKHIVDVIHKHHITQHAMEHSTSAPTECVLRTTELAKLSFNHPSVVLTADVFQ